jgi:hypothetical protein
MPGADCSGSRKPGLRSPVIAIRVAPNRFECMREMH